MKKTLLALAVMGVATSASALEIYNADGVTVDFGGDLEIRYQRDKADDAATTDQDETDFRQMIDDSDIRFDVRYQVMDGVQVGAYWGIVDIEGNASEVTDQDSDDTFVALYTDTTTVKIGRICTQLDDAGIQSDYAFGVNTFSGSTLEYCDDEMVRVDYDQGQFFGGVAVAQDKNDSNGLNYDDTFVDAKLGYRLNDFTFEAYYGAGESEDVTLGKETATSFQVHYDGLDKLALKAAIFNVSNDSTDETINDVDTVSVAAEYQYNDKISFATAYSTTSVTGGDDLDVWFVNADYALAPGSVVYVEVGGESTDGTQTGISTGVQVEF